MLNESAIVGIAPERFWDLTLKEVGILFAAYAFNLEQSYKKMIWQSWHTEAFHRVKSLPKLDQILQSDKKKSSMKRQTVAEQIAVAKAFTLAKLL